MFLTNIIKIRQFIKPGILQTCANANKKEAVSKVPTGC